METDRVTVFDIVKDFESGHKRLFVPPDARDEDLIQIGGWFDDLAKHEPYTGNNFFEYFQAVRDSDRGEGSYAFLNTEGRNVYDAASAGYFAYDSREYIIPITIEEFMAYVKEEAESSSDLSADFDRVWG